MSTSGVYLRHLTVSTWRGSRGVVAPRLGGHAPEHRDGVAGGHEHGRRLRVVLHRGEDHHLWAERAEAPIVGVLGHCGSVRVVFAGIWGVWNPQNSKEGVTLATALMQLLADGQI